MRVRCTAHAGAVRCDQWLGRRVALRVSRGYSWDRSAGSPGCGDQHGDRPGRARGEELVAHRAEVRLAALSHDVDAGYFGFRTLDRGRSKEKRNFLTSSTVPLSLLTGVSVRSKL